MRFAQSSLLRITCALATAIFCVPTLAQPVTVVTSDQASKSAFVVNKGINWYNQLDGAKQAARQQRKLVFWVHMLGSIDGAT
jgi:hypothetical protein